ncbi:tyrosine-type recombinase/integrase [Streptomyces sp. NPDC057413]|uniref:tyrosine-type recombinase/integrase n=1 Tax=Streptomyces sp. NPDC057413 TaxID=3346124 RepID=UPI0036A55764
MATSGWIEDRWLKKRPNPQTGKRERTELYGKCLRYRVAGIPGVRKRSFATLDEAKEWKAKTIAAMKKKDFVDERDGDILLGDYITDEWWPGCEYDETTADTMRQKIFKHIVDSSLGRTQMNAIGEEHLKAWKKELQAKPLADSTIEVVWTYLSSIFKSALGKRIARNPCQDVDKSVRPKGAPATKARAWTAEEARAIREAMTARYRVVADLGMYAGLRQGEAFAFSPDDIDETRMVLHVRRQLQWTKTKPVAYFKLPKGRKERSIPLSPGLLQLLRAHEQAFPPITVTLPWKGPGNDNKPTAKVRLMASTHWGNVIRWGTFNGRTMKPALAAAGVIAPREGNEHWGWEQSREMMHHRWRHTYASVQLGAGEDPVSVSHWMGHASITITLETYAHFMPDNGTRGRTAMDSWLGRTAAAGTAAANPREVEPLAYTVATKLALPAATGSGTTELLVSGARYGGAWAVGAQLEQNGVLLGEIRTEPSENGDRALAAGLAWVEEYCGRNGLTVARAENLSGQFPAEVRPYQALGRFLLVPGEGVS